MKEAGDHSRVRPGLTHLRLFVPLAVIVAACAVAGTVAGFSAFDHCPGLGCDFITTFYAQGVAVVTPPFHIAPFWRLPPFAALVFAPFGTMSLAAAARVWMALNVALAVVLIAMCARELDGPGRVARVAIAIALVAASLPVLHDIKWGQVSLLVCVGTIAALRSRRAGPVGLGLLTAFKVYPLAYAVAPLAERGWKTLAATFACAIGFGALLPLLLLGPDRTMALATNMLATAPGSGDWENHRSIVFYGGQSLGASIERWFHDGRHIGLSRTEGLVASLPAPVAMAVAVLASIAVLAATTIRLARRCLGPAHAAALCLTGVTLVVPPAWHHYFAFLPFAQAVALGASGSRLAGALAVASWLASALPLTMLGLVDRVYFFYSVAGGTTVSALLAWWALLAVPDDSDGGRSGQPGPGGTKTFNRPGT